MTLSLKVLFSDKSKFCISFGNQGPRVWRKSGEAQNPCCLKSSVKFPQSVMIWGAVTSAGVGPLCFIKSKVNFGALYASICCQALWRCWFPFQQDFSTSPQSQNHSSALLTMILLSLIGQPTSLTWTLSGIYGIFSRERWETVDSTTQTSWRLNNASAVPQSDRSHATPHWCCSLCWRSPGQVLSG